MKKNKKILILVPGINARGGITNYYQVLKNQFSYSVEYFTRGARKWPIRKGWLNETIRAVKDVIRFFLLLKTGNYSLIQTNTSLGNLALIRDGIFILAAMPFKVKIVVFFRGLDVNFQRIIEKKYLGLFKQLFFLSDCSIVLSSQFRNKLLLWGYRKPIYLETTVVDENLIKTIDQKFVVEKYTSIQNRINLLFLARIEIAKGIYETIATYILLKKKYPQIELSIAGDGYELDNVKNYVKKKSIADVNFHGFVYGIKKAQLYKDAHIYIFPSYREGMPNSLLEAMAFGLPIITRPVGGIVDIFKNGINGFICETKDPVDFAQNIEKLLENKNLMQEIATKNFRYAKEKFFPTKVVARLENIYTQTLRDG